ncbi:MAG: carbohydrate ABC transporter permease [bacterium]|nr:carbohydrate ABC transporter permease [bacterium]
MKKIFKFSLKQQILILILTICSVIAMFPFAVMVLLSGKSYAQRMYSIWNIPTPVQWGNYLFGLHVTMQYIGNSIIISGAILLITVFVATIAAYAFSRLNFRGKKVSFTLIISLLMVPGILTLIPLFLVVRSLGLLNTYWGIILPQVATSLPVAIYLLKTFFDNVPDDLFAAARVDGAGHFKTMWHILLPLCMPVFSTLAVINVLASWNNYIWVLLCVKDATLRTIPLGLAFIQTEDYLKYKPGLTMAAYLIASLPMVIVFFIALKPFMKGMTQGAVKF